MKSKIILFAILILFSIATKAQDVNTTCKEKIKALATKFSEINDSLVMEQVAFESTKDSLNVNNTEDLSQVIQEKSQTVRILRDSLNRIHQKFLFNMRYHV